jgi:transcriptional regulator with XRE-family HTH domain
MSTQKYIKVDLFLNLYYYRGGGGYMATGVGERIKKRRLELEWSQEELARRMGFKSKSTICKIENGEDNLTTTAVKKYADALLTTPSYLMGWEDDIVKYVDDSFNDSGVTKDSEDIDKAKALYKLYSEASPEVQSAVELILKSAQPKP